MTNSTSRWRKRLGLALVASGLLSGSILCWQWSAVQSWYLVRGLTQASAADCEHWIPPLLAQQDMVLSRLLRCLQQDEEQACANVELALEKITGSWPPADERRGPFAAQCAQCFPSCSAAGQRALLHVIKVVHRDAAAGEPLLSPLVRMVLHAVGQGDSAVRRRALEVSLDLVERAPTAEVVAACREAVTQGSRDGAAEVRLLAIHLAQARGLGSLDRVVPLLEDADVSVRRAAMLVVGTARDAIAEDDLLRWLHDSDTETRLLCEQALRGRGLQDQHLKLGKLLTAPQPGTRLQVLEQLQRANDLDPGVWLRRLSHDPSSAVRAAAVRAAVEQPQVDLSERLEQMAENDPSATVRDLARFYLRVPKQ